MKYLYLSFAEHLENDSKNRDFYNLSLIKQYELLKRRIPDKQRIDDFKVFIERCFPPEFSKTYYLSCPNILREKNEDRYRYGFLYLNNLVIRPERTAQMRQCLPENQNVILIGDLKEGQYIATFSVKGIQFIDDHMVSQNDISIPNVAVNISFRRGSWSGEQPKHYNSWFTPDSVLDIVENCYTIDDPANVIKTYVQWKEYFDFREYYLNEQRDKKLALDGVSLVDSYAINRKEYKKNSLQFDEYILDGHEEFKQGDMIVISESIASAETFPLIKVDIKKNKKEFESLTEEKRGKKFNQFEHEVRSLVNDNVIITSINPEILSTKDGIGKLIKDGYELGDKFKIIKFDIEPYLHIKQAESASEKNIQDGKKAIDIKYVKQIDNEVKEYINKVKDGNEKEIINKITTFASDLDKTLSSDINKNEDKEILLLIDKEKQSIKKSIKQNKGEKEKDYKARLNERFALIDIEKYYIERNHKRIFNFEKKLRNDFAVELKRMQDNKKIELGIKYKSDIIKENFELESKEKLRLDEQIAKIKEEETEICFSIYFKPNDKKDIDKKDKEKIENCKYIVYDDRAESAKLKRQKDALENFYNGNVKNPYLSTYLFAPETLPEISYKTDDWTWYLESLNDKQKEAVRKAVASNGLFLLQGPPGTGKTQVIAETVAHLVKDGKKVLVSSETHKAIDNVFERLPKVADIVPIRLIGAKSNKNSEYTPKYLVDNFYKNISTNMNNIVEKYKNFEEYRISFKDNIDELYLLKAKIDKSTKQYESTKKSIAKLNKQINDLNKQISSKEECRENKREEIDVLNRTKRQVDKYNFDIERDDIKKDIIAKYFEEIKQLFGQGFQQNNLDDLISTLINLSDEEIRQEIETFNPESVEQITKARLELLKQQMNKIHDECDGEIDNNEEYKKINKEWKELKKKSKEQKYSTDNKKLDKIFTFDFIANHKDELFDIIITKRNQILNVKNGIVEFIDSEISKLQKNVDNDNNEINAIRKQIKNISYDIAEIEDSNEYQSIQSDKLKLEMSINKIVQDFEIFESYSDVDEAIKIIQDKFEDLSNNYQKLEKENKEKIPMYEKISKFLSQTDVVEQDRKLYTKDLFESANVFGITCTSSDKFRKENNAELDNFDLDDIDIKTVGIDVVIIDEVSKSSFVDLLIPILYGKTVILVGDHRQLPPMYEFAKMREEDFVGLNEEYVTFEKNKKFTKMYEECFFKTLFEKISDDYKTMLQQQYRCHEHIMKVFNHFYQGELKLGFEGQNNQKKHNIDLKFNDRTLIQRDKHIYFVDCKQFETRDSDSTSIYNMGETKVVVELLKKLKIFYKNSSKIDPLSVGVICTYGDQAKKIKKLIQTEKIKADDFKMGAEKLVVSTVDDFQGDERDIIILSTVRNPQEPAKSKPGFILAYQRINVALSRARKLLIIVGNQDYLEKKGVIDLPDIYGRPGKNHKDFRVYEEILNTIETYGKILKDVDILNSKEE